jgi:hypothetical protein
VNLYQMARSAGREPFSTRYVIPCQDGPRGIAFTVRRSVDASLASQSSQESVMVILPLAIQRNRSMLPAVQKNGAIDTAFEFARMTYSL